MAGSTTGARARSTMISACGLVTPALSRRPWASISERAASSAASRRARAIGEPATKKIDARQRWPARPIGLCSSRVVGGVDAPALQPHARHLDVLQQRAAFEGLVGIGQAERRDVPADQLGAGRRRAASAGSRPGSRCSRSPPAAAIRAARRPRARSSVRCSASSPSER